MMMVMMMMIAMPAFVDDDYDPLEKFLVVVQLEHCGNDHGHGQRKASSSKKTVRFIAFSWPEEWDDNLLGGGRSRYKYTR